MEKIRYILQFLKKTVNYFLLVMYDYKVLLTRSTLFNPKSDFKESLRTKISIFSHELERGLTLPSPKVFFAQQHLSSFFSYLKEYEAKYGFDYFCYEAIGILHSWYDFDANFLDKNACWYDDLKKYLSLRSDMKFKLTGIKSLSKSTFFQYSDVNIINFMESRSSVRNFTAEDVDVQTIINSIKTARYSPSACNRQDVKVHIITEKKEILKINEYQGGASGFSDTINKLLLITSDMRKITNVKEYKQPWIDAGLFAMALLLSLHSNKLGACIMNWNAEPSINKKVHKFLGIDDSEIIIARIALGHVFDNIITAKSPRIMVTDMVTIHGSRQH